MPIIQGNGSPTNDPYGRTFFSRRLFVTDKDGVEHEIIHPDDLLNIIAQMTPEQKKDWETRYRFAPVQNGTGNPYYTGSQYDR